MKAAEKKTVIRKAAKPAAAEENNPALEVNGMGEVTIHEDVIAALVRKAALETEGVSRLAGSTLVDDIAKIVGSSRMQARSIAIFLEEDGRVAIDVKIIIKPGFKIPVVGTAVQKAVIEQVESITGMTVTRVNVIVQKVEDENPPEAEEEDGDGEIDIAPMPG